MRTEQEIFNELAALCATPGYAHALASLCFRDEIVTYRDELRGEDYARLFSYDRLIRTEMSTLFGLMARVPLDLTLPTPEKIQGMIDRSEGLLAELHEAMLVPFDELFNKALTDPERPNPFLAPGAMREPIFYGAESAYSFQYRDLAPVKYARDADWLRENKGFTIADAQAVVKSILVFLNSHSLDVVRGLRDVPKESWTVLNGFVFKIDDILPGSGLSADIVSKVLKAFTLPAGGNPSFTSLHEFNATNAFPLLNAGDDRYILFQYVSLTEALYDTPFYWLFNDRRYRDTASANRGFFTEEFTAERLRAVFGAENVFCNVDIWESKAKKSGEIDVLVLFAGHALVVQAKSKKLTLVARKGNDLQLRDDFKAAVQDACDQAIACSEQLLAGTARFADAAGNDIAIPKIKVVHPICVVSEHYPALAFQAHQFLQHPQRPKIKFPLVCDVFFIDAVAEMLETPLRVLSYLELRAIAGENVLLSHEITALAFHLRQNLWMEDYDQLQLADDIAADLNIAMAVRRDGIEGKRTPKGILTALKGTAVGRLLDEVTADGGAIATGVGLHLLKLSGNTANDLSRVMDTLAAKSAREGRRLLDTTLGIAKGQTGITVHCTGADHLSAAMTLRRHCQLRKHSTRAQTWCGIAIEPGTGKYRFGILLDDPWQPNADLDEQLKSMSSGVPPSAMRQYARSGVVPRSSTPRNAPCTCGSGKKFKRCCGEQNDR